MESTPRPLNTEDGSELIPILRGLAIRGVQITMSRLGRLLVLTKRVHVGAPADTEAAITAMRKQTIAIARRSAPHEARHWVAPHVAGVGDPAFARCPAGENYWRRSRRARRRGRRKMSLNLMPTS